MVNYVYALYILGAIIGVFFQAQGGTADADFSTKLVAHLPCFAILALMSWTIIQQLVRKQLGPSLFVMATLSWVLVVLLSLLIGGNVSEGTITNLERYIIWAVGGAFAYSMTIQGRLTSRGLLYFITIIACIYCLRSLHLLVTLGGFSGLTAGNQGIVERQTMLRQFGTQYGYAILWCLPMLVFYKKSIRLVLMAAIVALFCIFISSKYGIYLSLLGAIIPLIFYRLLTSKSLKELKIFILSIAPYAITAVAALFLNRTALLNQTAHRIATPRKLGNGREEIWTLICEKWWNADWPTQVFGFGFCKVEAMMKSCKGIRLFAHNDWLEALFDFGIVGFVILLCIHLSLARGVFISFSRFPTLFPPLFTSFVFLFVASIVSTTVVIGLHAILLYFTLGHLLALVHLREISGRKPDLPKGSPRPPTDMNHGTKLPPTDIQGMFSIIIPTWNRETLIVETLESIKLQTYTNWECIIVDDHSTDDTFAIAQKYANKDPRFRVISRPSDRPKGPASCRNAGLSQAEGGMVVFFDSDDLMNENYLQVVSDTFQFDQGASADCAFLRTDHFDLDPAEPFFYSPTLLKDSRYLIDEILSWKLVDSWNLGFVWKRDFLVQKNARYPQEMMHFEDIAFSYGLICEARKCVYVNHFPLIHIRKGRSDSLAGAAVRDEQFTLMNFEMLRGLFEKCEKLGKMNSYVRKNFLRQMIVMEISALLAGFPNAASEMRRFIVEQSQGPIIKPLFTVSATLLIWSGPLIRSIGWRRRRLRR